MLTFDISINYFLLNSVNRSKFCSVNSSGKWNLIYYYLRKLYYISWFPKMSVYFVLIIISTITSTLIPLKHRKKLSSKVKDSSLFLSQTIWHPDLSSLNKVLQNILLNPDLSFFQNILKFLDFFSLYFHTFSTISTYFRPTFPLHTSWKHEKTSWGMD